MEKTLLLLILSLSGLSLESTDTVRKYHYVDLAYSWFEAQAHCREKFVNLATVRNQEDSDRLLKVLRGRGSDAWIGLLDDLTRWVWTTPHMYFNKKKHYSNWEMEKFNTTNSRSKCALMKTSSAWLDRSCDEEHLSVCYDEERPHTYIVVNESMKFKDAKEFCQTNHTNLVMVRNSTVNKRIASLLPADAWIGLFRWNWTTWSDHGRVKFKNWVKVQPNATNRMVESCAAVVAATAMWRADECYLKRPFICYSIQKTREVRVKLKFLSEANLQDPAVNQQILKQLHMKLAKNISEFQIRWTEQDGQIFHKENDDRAGRVEDLSDRCAENINK